MVRVGVGGVATGIALYVLSFLTFVGNAMVLHAIRTEKRLQTVSELRVQFALALRAADWRIASEGLPRNWIGAIACQRSSKLPSIRASNKGSQFVQFGTTPNGLAIESPQPGNLLLSVPSSRPF